MNDKGQTGQALECYNQATQELLTKKHPKSFRIARDRGVTEEWVSSDEPIGVYKQNYFLIYSHSSHPSSAPTSPNPLNGVPYTYPLDNKEIKFQISLKAHLMGENRHALWFGHTQLAFWQPYDPAHSSPFRENDYEPELIYSYRPDTLELGGVCICYLNAGLVHQSNGQSLPKSPGWNRFYLQAGVKEEFGDNGKLALMPRWWKMLGGKSSNDDNPDILNYLGHGELETR